MGNLIIKVVKTKNIKHKETELNRLANILKHVGKRKEKNFKFKKTKFQRSNIFSASCRLYNYKLTLALLYLSPPHTHNSINKNITLVRLSPSKGRNLSHRFFSIFSTKSNTDPPPKKNKVMCIKNLRVFFFLTSFPKGRKWGLLLCLIKLNSLS